MEREDRKRWRIVGGGWGYVWGYAVMEDVCKLVWRGGTMFPGGYDHRRSPGSRSSRQRKGKVISTNINIINYHAYILTFQGRYTSGGPTGMLTWEGQIMHGANKHFNPSTRSLTLKVIDIIDHNTRILKVTFQGVRSFHLCKDKLKRSEYTI